MQGLGGNAHPLNIRFGSDETPTPQPKPIEQPCHSQLTLETY